MRMECWGTTLPVMNVCYGKVSHWKQTSLVNHYQNGIEMEIALGCERVKSRQEDCAVCCCGKTANLLLVPAHPMIRSEIEQRFF